VQDIFKALGAIKHVRVLRDKGLNAGAAYVMYEQRSAAQHALHAINGQEICGKARAGYPMPDLAACASLRSRAALSNFVVNP